MLRKRTRLGMIDDVNGGNSRVVGRLSGESDDLLPPASSMKSKAFQVLGIRPFVCALKFQPCLFLQQSHASIEEDNANANSTHVPSDSAPAPLGLKVPATPETIRDPRLEF
jgi:hypothetical protein